jgi:hypothetical protein
MVGIINNKPCNKLQNRPSETTWALAESVTDSPLDNPRANGMGNATSPASTFYSPPQFRFPTQHLPPSSSAIVGYLLLFPDS